MKKLSGASLIIFLFIAFNSCSISPVPIEYNVDQCHACKMIIADSRFGAELITLKGKVYKYDAVECLVPEIKKNGEDHYKFVLVTDFDDPKTLIDARISSYLISDKLPSPMGGFLSAYSSKGHAVEALTRNDGKLYTWEELKQNDLFAYLD